ncbi:Tripartite motif-containing protein 16 [Anabarilius grahami]|uniref:Tripartite motif-containing protein 16 n=1 Tax=Anabarilius grahami TaxID=495550 RepID=A0A3N0Y508_ANAGA|nr:Tripartite motif-containing protein 16 [Anabarilius grahami]
MTSYGATRKYKGAPGETVFISSSFGPVLSDCIYTNSVGRSSDDDRPHREMAEANISVDQDQFTCPVCLDLLKDPVTIPCGHSYCMSCITDCWNQEDQKGIYRCSLCKQTFTPRPVLSKNVVFAEMVEKLKKTRLQSDAPTPPAVAKQSHLVETQREFQKIIQQREKDVQQLREAVASHKRSAQTAVEDSERIFTELIRSIERRRSEVKQLIIDQERAAVSPAEERLKLLEQEINDLRRRDAELKQLSQTQDHVHFLQSLPSLYLSGSTDGFTVSSHLYFGYIAKSVSQLTDHLQQFCRETIEKTYRLDSHQLTLDPNSAHNCLRLSEENRVITVADKPQPYPDYPDRFDYWMEALCREIVNKQCYWEVEWSGDGRSGVVIGVTYMSISRKGNGPESIAGFNNKSWSLYCTPTFCSFCHNNIETVLPVVSSSLIGVYVNHSAGILSFYSVSDTMSLIHRVQTTFTQPLYAVFGLDRHSRVKLCRLKN